MSAFGQIVPSGLVRKRPIIGRGNPNGFQFGFPGQEYTDESTNILWIKGTTNRTLGWIQVGPATGNPTVYYGANGDASPPGVLSAAGPAVWYGFYGDIYAKLTPETGTSNWFPLLTLADIGSQGAQFFFSSFGTPLGSPGVDPVLGFPYVPVDYELTITAPADFANGNVLLNWSVPSLVANPANYRIYNVSADNLYYWRSNNPVFPGGTPTLVLPGAFSSVANSGGTNINLAYLWMAKANTLDYGSGARAPLVIGPTTTLTSGTLVPNAFYIITTFVAGDSFTNVGASSNASGVAFKATGATPTTWTHGSTLQLLVGSGPIGSVGTSIPQTWSPNNLGSVIMWDERTASLGTPTIPPDYSSPASLKVKAYPLGQNIIEFDIYRTNAITPAKTGNFELWVQLPGTWDGVNVGYTDPSDAHALPRTTDYAAYFYKLIGYTDGTPPNNTFAYNIVYMSNAPAISCPSSSTPTSLCAVRPAGGQTTLTWSAPDVSWFPALS